MASRVPYMVAVGNHEYVHAEPSTSNANGVDVSGVQGPSFRPAWSDYRDDSFGECAVPVVARFDGSGGPPRAPSGSSKAANASAVTAGAARGAARGAAAGAAGTDGNLVFWYSFDYGIVHFTVMSSEHDWQAGSTQHGWVAADLAAVNRTKTPWVVVQLHRPMYSSEPSNNPGWSKSIFCFSLRICSRTLMCGVLSGQQHATF